MLNRKWIASLACCVLFTWIGQPVAAAPQEGKAEPRPGSNLDAIRKVSQLLGTNVLNKANETIAQVADLALTPEGTVPYAILRHGGVAGVGAKYVAVPWEAMDARHLEGKWAVNLDMPKEALANAPTFQSDNFTELTNPEWVERVGRFFPARADRSRQPGREATAHGPRPVQIVLLASKINDAKLRNNRNEDVGEVEDLLLDRNDRVAYAVIGRGGVLGIGESFVPVPWTKLRLNYDKQTNAITALIDATKQQLEQAPLVKGGSYSTLLAPGFTGQVDRYFGVTRAGEAAGQ